MGIFLVAVDTGITCTGLYTQNTFTKFEMDTF